MILQDYKFRGLNNVFFSHLGISMGKNYSEVRKAQIKINLAQYKVFFTEMKEKYGKDPFKKAGRRKLGKTF